MNKTFKTITFISLIVASFLLTNADELKPRDNLIINIKESIDNLKKIEKFGFEITCEQIFSGRQLTLIGMIDNKSPANSWFILVDNAFFNMPIEGYINGEYFIHNMDTKKIAKVANCSFKILVDSNIQYNSINECVYIGKNNKANSFNISFPRVLDSDEVIPDNSNIKTFKIKKEHQNYYYLFSNKKLVSHFICNKSNSLNNFSLFLYFDINNLEMIKTMINKYLNYAEKNQMLKLENIDSEDIDALRTYYLLFLSTQTKSISEKSILKYEESLINDMKLMNEVKEINSNLSFFRNKFLEYVFNNDETLNKWPFLLQNEEKWKNRIDEK